MQWCWAVCDDLLCFSSLPLSFSSSDRLLLCCTASKVFLNFTKNQPKIHAEVYKRLKEPLLTLMTGPSVELSFVVLAHIQSLVGRAPGVFDDKYKHFFCRYVRWNVMGCDVLGCGAME